MHPIERLRAVARAREVDQTLLAREAASVLGAFAGDPLGLVTACRRLLDRHPSAAALWWTFARLLDTADVRAEAHAIRRDLDADPVATALSLDLPDRAVVAVVPDVAGGSELASDLLAWREDIVVAHDPGALHVDRPEPRILLVEAGAAGPDRFLAPAGAGDELAAVREAGVAVWLVVDVGRRLPKPLFEALVRRSPSECEQLGVREAERVVEPRRIDCPVPPELLRSAGSW